MERHGVIEGQQKRRSWLWLALAALILLGAGYLLARYGDWREEQEVEASDLDTIVTMLRENRNRLEVQKLSGEVTTKREVRGGPGNIFRGVMKARQPWSVNYYVDMAELGLDDYIWDARTRTLIVRAPAVEADPPNIDESRQIVANDGLIITRGMQTKLRGAVAKGAKQQAVAEARKPEHLAKANEAAKIAIARNLKDPLQAAGIRGVNVQVVTPTDGNRNSERWDVSRSIAEVLAERAAR